MRGCVAYDCFGAGQATTALLAPATGAPDPPRPAGVAFQRARAGARDCVAPHRRPDARRATRGALLEETESLAARDEEGPLDADVEELRARVGPALRGSQRKRGRRTATRATRPASTWPVPTCGARPPRRRPARCSASGGGPRRCGPC